SSVGIDVPGVFSFSWMLASVVAALAGILVGSVGGISSAMGVFGLSVFVVVILGGLDSIAGALIAGLFVGWLEAMVGLVFGGEFKLLATFSILLIVLTVRPYGLFGTHEIERL
ncbi:MAG: ABC transporter permease subunit, partial [Phreatobacter sp.]